MFGVSNGFPIPTTTIFITFSITPIIHSIPTIGTTNNTVTKSSNPITIATICFTAATLFPWAGVEEDLEGQCEGRVGVTSPIQLFLRIPNDTSTLAPRSVIPITNYARRHVL